MLRKISAEREVQRPSQRDAELFLKGRKLRKINCPPQPPCRKTREAQAKNIRHSVAMPDRCELAQSPEAEGCSLGTAYGCYDVLRAMRRFAQGVLCGGRMWFASVGIWSPCAIANRPDSGKPRHFEHFVDNDASLFLFDGQALQDPGGFTPAVQTRVCVGSVSSLLSSMPRWRTR